MFDRKSGRRKAQWLPTYESLPDAQASWAPHSCVSVDKCFASAPFTPCLCQSGARSVGGPCPEVFCLLWAIGPELDLAFPGLPGSATPALRAPSLRSRRFGQQPDTRQLWSLVLGPPRLSSGPPQGCPRPATGAPEMRLTVVLSWLSGSLH